MTADQFKEARRALGLSQSRLATVLGMGADGGRTIRRWENGERPPNPIACRALEWIAAGYVQMDRQQGGGAA